MEIELNILRSIELVDGTLPETWSKLDSSLAITRKRNYGEGARIYHE